MKSLRLILILLAGLSGCVLLDDGLVGGKSRSDCLRGGSAPGGTPPAGPAVPDTAILFSAVRFPDGYDWQRDSSYGAADCELLLYRDFRPVLCLHSGPDACFVPDPDRHHLLSGHLYTERMAGGQTLIGRDGKELFRFEGREFLVGLLEDGPDLYTLSRKASGSGFTYRQNGRILLSHGSGVPYGSLEDPSYAPTGALYRDGEQIVFCFHTGKRTTASSYLVRNGEETPLGSIPNEKILDLKLRDAHPLTLSPLFSRTQLRDGRIWLSGTSYAITGQFTNGIASFSGWIPSFPNNNPERICPEDATLYYADGDVFAVSADPAGTVRWYGPDGNGQSGEGCHFPSTDCALVSGGRLVLALTPRDPRKPPQLRIGERVTEVALHGYISGVAVEISPPAN